jgi:fibronectin-binding autotransporter adhesin
MTVRAILASCACAALIVAMPARAGEIAVTSDADAGPGTLRAALAAAAGVDRIVVSVAGGNHMIALAADLPALAGTVTLDFGDAPGTVTIAGGAWALASGAGLVVMLGPRRRAVLDGAIAGETGDRGLTVSGGGTLVLARAASYRGGTILKAGTLRLEHAGNLPPTGRLALESGVLELGDADVRVAGLAGSGGEIALGDRSLTVDQNADGIFAGTISGAGRLVKGGEGRLTLEAPQGWTGGTTITGGVLELAGGSAGLRLIGPIEVKGGALVAPGVSIGSGRR